MPLQPIFSVHGFSVTFLTRFFVASLSLCISALALPPRALAQDLIPAAAAFDSPACSDVDLGGVDIIVDTVPSPNRGNPEWKAIILDSSKAPHLQPPTILEGFVSPQPSDQTSSSQSTSEVAEEDLPWTHFTHDFTFKVLPDPNYQHLLSSWARFQGETIPDLPEPFCSVAGGTISGTACVIPPEICPDGSMGPTCPHTDMEVEWDSASLMDEKEGFQRDWGAVPEFVWPGVGDRVWVAGRWIFDCGHPGSSDKQYVKFSTEIHPPKALVTFRLNHVSLDSFPRARVSAPNFSAPQSYLPVTGQPVTLPPDAPNSGPTNVPVTEADIFVSVNAGGAGDLCTIVPVPCSDYGGHTGSIIPVNDRNYVFDIYPPGTVFGSLFGFGPPLINGTIPVGPPVPDASLQWRVVDHFSELPLHACGGKDNTVCQTVDPIICLVDSSTPAPTQSETTVCPAVPAQPTRLRVILPFAGTNANFFAKSILVGWDDVPNKANGTTAIPVRTFKIKLHQLTVKDNGSGCCNNSDWRVFVNIGGQYRYISPYFDAKDDGSSLCNGSDPAEPLTNNGNNDCYYFDGIPWTVSVQDGTPIHVAVGGFVARGVEDSGSSLFPCRADFTAGCDAPGFSVLDSPFRDFPFQNDDRIGTYEFDLVGPDYAPPAAFTTAQFGCTVQSFTGCSLRYQTQFTVTEVTQAAPPSSNPLVIGTPKFGQFISSATPLTIGSASSDAEGFQYRFEPVGGPLPVYTFTPTQPFPVHWTHVDLPSGSQSVALNLDGVDGAYNFQYSAQNFAQLLETRHSQSLTLDDTPPVNTITQPQAMAYAHNAKLTLDYSVSDGTGSGVASFTPTMDGATVLTGVPNLQSGTPISLLTALALGSHTFKVSSTDNVNNFGATSVTFTIVVTPASIEGDVTQFLQMGAIKNAGLASTIMSNLIAAAAARQRGQCNTAANIYTSFINAVLGQRGKGIAVTAADIMIADAQYLISHCP
jgi:hypothetical protein